MNRLVEYHINNYPENLEDLDQIIQDSNVEEGVFSLSLVNKEGGYEFQMMKKE